MSTVPWWKQCHVTKEKEHIIPYIIPYPIGSMYGIYMLTFTINFTHTISYHIWLVVYLPLWKIWVRQWEGWHPIYIYILWKIKKKCLKPPSRYHTTSYYIHPNRSPPWPHDPRISTPHVLSGLGSLLRWPSPAVVSTNPSEKTWSESHLGLWHSQYDGKIT